MIERSVISVFSTTPNPIRAFLKPDAGVMYEIYIKPHYNEQLNQN